MTINGRVRREIKRVWKLYLLKFGKLFRPGNTLKVVGIIANLPKNIGWQQK
jgi:hypothetical protein